MEFDGEDAVGPGNVGQKEKNQRGFSTGSGRVYFFSFDQLVFVMYFSSFLVYFMNVPFVTHK